LIRVTDDYDRYARWIVTGSGYKAHLQVGERIDQSTTATVVPRIPVIACRRNVGRNAKTVPGKAGLPVCDSCAETDEAKARLR
jgi:hypothetical protein